MALSPSSLGPRVRTLRLERVGEQSWRTIVDEHPLAATFGSERDAWEAGAAELVRLDALAFAMLRHIRSASSRKRP
jgi:hypothetical protein